MSAAQKQIAYIMYAARVQDFCKGMLYVVDKIDEVVLFFFFKSRPPYQAEKEKKRR